MARRTPRGELHRRNTTITEVGGRLNQSHHRKDNLELGGRLNATDDNDLRDSGQVFSDP